jgi:beta-phosphoglucomutase-like phosphatase (HAD superfamily)
MIIDWEGGLIDDRPCINKATKYTVDSFGIFYLCDECYKEDCKRRMDSDSMTLKKSV